MILECTNIFKKVLKKAIQKVVKEKSFQKSAEKKYSEKLFGSRVGSKKLFFSKKTLNKVFFVKKVLIKGNAQQSIPSRGYSLEIYISFVEREIQCSTPGWTPLPLLAEYCEGPPEKMISIIVKSMGAYTCLGSWMCKTWRLYEVFCSHAWVLALFRFEYSEDLKVSPQEVWLTWWNLSTVICSFMNLFVSRFRPNSFVLQMRVRKSRISRFLYTKTFRIERVNQDIVHFTTYCIKKTIWHTQFSDLIHTFIWMERRRIMKKEKKM